MSETEMESLWMEQTSGRLEAFDAREWLRSARRRQNWSGVSLLVPAVISLAALALKFTQIASDPRYTLGNAWIELLLAAVPFLAVVFAFHLFLRKQRELAALKSDMRSCVDHILRKTRGEIRELTTGVPLAFGGIAILFGLAKWQSIATGRETLAHEVTTILLAVGLIAVGSVVLYHRVNAFLRPRLEHFENLRRTFMG